MVRQGDLFSEGADAPLAAAGPEPQLALNREQLLRWQARLAAHQAPLFDAGTPSTDQQGLLFPAEEPKLAPPGELQLLTLRCQPLSFWRWPQAGHRGAALYFVTDHPGNLPRPLLLYVGETGQADRRWKGDHDCKTYLARYSEALRREALEVRLGIRFWLDVPDHTHQRRRLEQTLIQRWLPPFNKETRGRWTAPFTALSD